MNQLNRCAHFDCEREIPDNHLACHEHWSLLPKRLRFRLEGAWQRLGTGVRAELEYRQYVELAEVAWNAWKEHGLAEKQ